MQTPVIKFSKRLGAAALSVAGLMAAATAQAGPGKDLSPAPRLTLPESPRQCSDVDAIVARLRYPTGTTFLLTDAGLIVLKQPKAVKTFEPDPWGNSGG